MQVRSCQKDVHPRIFRGFQCLDSRHNVIFAGARQCGDRHFLHFVRNRHHRFQVALGSNGEPCLNYIYAQGSQLVSHADLFRGVHGEAG